MELKLIDEEVEAYFQLIEENKDLVDQLGKAGLKLAQFQHTIHQLEDKIAECQKDLANQKAKGQ